MKIEFLENDHIWLINGTIKCKLKNFTDLTDIMSVYKNFSLTSLPVDYSHMCEILSSGFEPIETPYGLKKTDDNGIIKVILNKNDIRWFKFCGLNNEFKSKKLYLNYNDIGYTVYDASSNKRIGVFDDFSFVKEIINGYIPYNKVSETLDFQKLVLYDTVKPYGCTTNFVVKNFIPFIENIISSRNDDKYEITDIIHGSKTVFVNSISTKYRYCFNYYGNYYNVLCLKYKNKIDNDEIYELDNYVSIEAPSHNDFVEGVKLCFILLGLNITKNCDD